MGISWSEVVVDSHTRSPNKPSQAFPAPKTTKKYKKRHMKIFIFKLICFLSPLILAQNFTTNTVLETTLENFLEKDDSKDYICKKVTYTKNKIAYSK